MGQEMVGRRLAEIETPAAIVDYDILRRNIERMADLARRTGVKLRPHVKTHKCPPITHLQWRAGASGITVAKVGEAEVMAQAGIDDILIAYPLVDPGRIRRLLGLRRWVKRIACTVDSLVGAERLSAAVADVRGQAPLDVLIEVDTGLHRVGLAPGRPVVEFARELAGLKGIRVRGLLTHAGHAHAVAGDDRAAVARDEARLMAETAGMLAEAGLPVEEVSIGSTPTMSVWRGWPGITEIRPGTYVFNDANLARSRAAGLEDCALSILATVTSKPAPDRLILDAGSKSLAGDRANQAGGGFGIIKGRPGLVLERIYEEHGVARTAEEDEAGIALLEIGDRVEIIPNHACTAVNLADELVVVQDGMVIAVWEVSGRGKTR